MTPWWMRLLRHARPRAAAPLAAVALILVQVGFEALRPWPLKILVDDVLKQPAGGKNASAMILLLAAATVAIFLLAQLSRIAQGYLLAGFGARLSYNLGAAVFDKLQRLSLLVHSRKATGDLVRRVVTDRTCARDLLNSVAIPIVTSLSSLTVMLVILWRLDALLALIALGVIVPLAGVIRLLAGPMSRLSLAKQNSDGELMSCAERVLSAIPLVQTFTAETREDRRYVEQSQSAMRAYLRSMIAQLQFSTGTSTVTALGTALVMGIGGLRVLGGGLSVGELLVFLSYLSSLYAPLERLSYVSWSYASASASAKRVLEILDSEEMVRQSSDAISIPAPTIVSGAARLEISIAFDGVCFGYEELRPVLHDIDLHIPAGQTVALVGPSGAGKTTLASLVPRLFDPWQGAVRFNGVDLRRLRLSELRAAVAVVPQETMLLPLSVAENIAYGRAGASRAQIVDAARAANADEFIESLSDGYDTILGQRGATLSGGQRQRIAIARALLKDAPVLIFDEPTSALDPITERLVIDALRRLTRDRTCIIIAHRHSTIQHADRVAAMNQGELMEHHEMGSRLIKV